MIFAHIKGQCMLNMSIMCEFAQLHRVAPPGQSLTPNAILKLKHNGLLTLILTCAASDDLNPVYYAV